MTAHQTRHGRPRASRNEPEPPGEELFAARPISPESAARLARALSGLDVAVSLSKWGAARLEIDGERRPSRATVRYLVNLIPADGCTVRVAVHGPDQGRAMALLRRCLAG